MTVTSDDILRVQEIVALLGDAGADVADVDLTAGEHHVDVTLTARISDAVQRPNTEPESPAQSRRVHPAAVDTESVVTPHEGEPLDRTPDEPTPRAVVDGLTPAVTPHEGEPLDLTTDADLEDRAVAEVLATSAEADDPVTSIPGVEAWLVEELDSGETLTVTAQDIVPDVETNGSWVARALNQLQDRTDVLEIEREHQADPNTSTTYYITPVGDVDVDDAPGPRDVDEDTTPAVTAHEGEDAPAADEQTDADTERAASGRWDIDCERCDELDSHGDSLRWMVHRTEAHGLQYKNYLAPGEFDEAVDEAESIRDLAVAIGYSYQRTIRLLNIYGYEDKIDSDSNGRRSVTDFEFDDVDDADTDDDTDQEAVADGRGDDDTRSVFERLNLDPDDVVDALTGAQSVHDVKRELWSVSREDLGDLLDELGLLEDLDGGTARIDAPTARDAVQEVSL